eukprot:6482449-Amphidinium_carterae.1
MMDPQLPPHNCKQSIAKSCTVQLWPHLIHFWVCPSATGLDTSCAADTNFNNFRGASISRYFSEAADDAPQRQISLIDL